MRVLKKGVRRREREAGKRCSAYLDLFAFVDQVEYDSVTIRFMISTSQQ